MTDKHEDIQKFLENIPDKFDILEEGISFQTQKERIKDELHIVCKDLNTVLEAINSSETYVGVTILVPMDIAVGTVIETGIKKCNELGTFVFEHYYVTNQEIPDKSEIHALRNGITFLGYRIFYHYKLFHPTIL